MALPVSFDRTSASAAQSTLPPANDAVEKVKRVKANTCMYRNAETNLRCRRYAFSFDPCKCSKIFCREHKFPFQHKCTFNHRKAYQEQLRRKLMGEPDELKVNREHKDLPPENGAC